MLPRTPHSASMFCGKSFSTLSPSSGEETPPPGGFSFLLSIAAPHAPYGAPFFGAERRNRARKGLCNTHLAVWLPSAKFSDGLTANDTDSNPVCLFNRWPQSVELRKHSTVPMDSSGT